MNKSVEVGILSQLCWVSFFVFSIFVLARCRIATVDTHFLSISTG